MSNRIKVAAWSFLAIVNFVGIFTGESLARSVTSFAAFLLSMLALYSSQIAVMEENWRKEDEKDSNK